MKRNLLRRVTALILVFAMTFSLASMALAADVSDNVEVIDDTSVSETVEYDETTEEPSAEEAEEPADSSSVDEADASVAEEAEEAEEEADAAASEQVTEDTEVTEETDETYDASTTGTVKENGEIYYQVSGKKLLAADVSATYEYHWYGSVLYRFSQSSYDSNGYATGTESYSTSVLITEAPTSGTYAGITLDKIYFVKNGVPTACDNTYHWYLDTDGEWRLYYFGDSATYTWSVGTVLNTSHKIGSLPTALKGKYDTGYVYFFKNGQPSSCDKTYHFDSYNKVFYYFTDASSHQGYSVGTAYTGTYKFSSLPAAMQDTYDTGVVYYLNEGVGVADDGSYHWYKQKLYVFKNSSSQKAGISVGSLLNGVHKISSLPSSMKGTYDTGYFYFFSKGVPTSCDGTYHWGDTNNKIYYFDNASSHQGYSVGTAYTGMHYCGSIPSYVTGYTAGRWYSFKSGVGTLFTGVYNTYYVKDGVKTSTTGWVKYNSNYYYFKSSNKCITDTDTDTSKAYKLKGIGNSSSYYYYYFKSSGAVWTNLFSKSAAYKSKKMKIYTDDSDHNTTFLLYNSTSGSYDLAALQVICSTPKVRDGVNGLAYGTYYLSCTYRHSWAQNEAQNKWYCYFTHLNIPGTTTDTKSPYGFHSPQYYKKSYYSLVTSNYNKFGSNNTGGCIRLQTGYVALVYSISSKNTYKNVIVYYGKYSKKYSPFAIVTNADIQIPSTQTYDPTTPSSNL